MSLIPVGVGRAQESYGTKYSIAVGKHNAGGQGWTHDLAFMAFSGQMPNTVPICIGNTSTDWRCIVKWGVDASGNGWDHRNIIFVYAQHQPGTEAFTVSHSEPVWRWRISKGNGLSRHEKQFGWIQDFVFYAYPENHGNQSVGGNQSGRPPVHGQGFAPQPDSFFHIVSVHNGLCLGIDGSNELAMVNKTSSDNCLWKWQGNVLVNKAGKAMDLEGGSKDAGARVLGYQYHGRPNQHWKQKGQHIVSAHSDKVLDIMNNSRIVGAKVKMWTLNVPYTNNQMWRFEYHH